MSMKRLHTLLFPLFVLGAVVVAIVPLPAAALDVLLSAQLTTAVLVLLTAVYTPRPLEFSVFPSLLLGTTLGRLVLNIASTRLILTRGASEGTHAAGQVIAAFGQFVAGGELIVGLVVFLILVVVQFVVITKGASRISEVAARFMLDALPGRQAAIDADVRAGLVNQQQAARLRRELAEQADFYGAMDGASKFVRGDAVAGLVITAVNIAGGLTLGVLRHGMPLSEAAATFTTLTIGDGLVSQLPALLIAIAAALIATRSSTETELPRQITTQLSQHAEVLFLGAAFLVLLAATGLPALPLLLLA
ncbi:MAG: EscV/YscV/HrcV family type III secretion system export apparatus protein, partial [Planctomycetota bacterium]